MSVSKTFCAISPEAAPVVSAGSMTSILSHWPQVTVPPLRGDGLWRRRLREPGREELDRGPRADAAGLADALVRRRHRGEEAAQRVADRRRPREQAVALDDRDRGKRRRARDGMAAERRAQLAGLEGVE